MRRDALKSILITGGMSFLGLHTALKFMEEGYRAILCSRTERKVPLLEEKAGIWELPLRTLNMTGAGSSRQRRYGVEGIIHSALPDMKVRRNFQACMNLLEICRLENLKFVYVSSNGAYGYRPDSNPLSEADYVPVLAGSRLDEMAP